MATPAVESAVYDCSFSLLLLLLLMDALMMLSDTQCCIDELDDLLRLLVESGADVNARDLEQWTPLHAAATCGHVKLCRYLCQQYAPAVRTATTARLLCNRTHEQGRIKTGLGLMPQ